MVEPLDYGVMERHGQTILSLVVLAAILWFGANVVETKSDVKVLTVEVASLKAQITDLKKDRYTALDAEKDMNSLYKEISARSDQYKRENDLLWKKVVELESKVKDLEIHNYKE